MASCKNAHDNNTRKKIRHHNADRRLSGNVCRLGVSYNYCTGKRAHLVPRLDRDRISAGSFPALARCRRRVAWPAPSACCASNRRGPRRRRAASPTPGRPPLRRLAGHCKMGRKRNEIDAHYGRKWKEHRQNSHLIFHFPTSEGVSEVSERANE